MTSMNLDLKGMAEIGVEHVANSIKQFSKVEFREGCLPFSLSESIVFSVLVLSFITLCCQVLFNSINFVLLEEGSGFSRQQG